MSEHNVEAGPLGIFAAVSIVGISILGYWIGANKQDDRLDRDLRAQLAEYAPVTDLDRGDDSFSFVSGEGEDARECTGTFISGPSSTIGPIACKGSLTVNNHRWAGVIQAAD